MKAVSPGPALGLLIFLGIVLNAPAAPAEVQPDVSYVYYQVPYLPGRSVVEMIARGTPLGGGRGSLNLGLARWQLRFDKMTFSSPKIDVCRVEEPRVTCHCEVTLPQMQGGDPQTRSDFEEIEAVTREHELEHCRIAARHAGRLEQAFRDLKERDCDEMVPALRKVYEKIVDDCVVAQNRFDHAEYGYKQYLRAQLLKDLAAAGFNLGAPSAGRPRPRPAPQGQPTMTVLPQDNKEDLKREGIFQDENGVWRNY